MFQKNAIAVNGGVQCHCGTTCFQHERVLVLITSSLKFYWLRVHFVLTAAPGFLEMKPAVLYCISLYRNNCDRVVCGGGVWRVELLYCKSVVCVFAAARQ